MKQTIFSPELVSEVATGFGITDIENATIGQSVLIAQKLIEITGIPFVRMDQGVPGLPQNSIGVEAEIEALKAGYGNMYPAAEGVVVLKDALSRFIKAFMDIDVDAACCLPVTGSVAGSFGSFIACNQCSEGKDTVLFIDPGFPIQKSQLKVLGGKYKSFDIYNYRGEALRAKLEEFFKVGDISSIIYSNPNNPAWICLTELELQIIGELATKYNVIVLEDLAYFQMDSRKPFSAPFTAPFQPTVAKYTENYILMLSSSKIFSYAGQRSAALCVSNKLFNRNFPLFAQRYGGVGQFGSTLVNAIMYMITSGSTHTTQYGYAAMLNAASDGKLNFVEETSVYAHRAKAMKELFIANGFHVVYDKDLDEQIGDGFFFSIGYKGMSGGELLRNLIYFGVSSINLATTGSEQQGIRACASRVTDDVLALLAERLPLFNKYFTK